MLGLLFSQIEDLTDNEKIKLLVSKGKDVIGQLDQKNEDSKTSLKPDTVKNQTSNVDLDKSEDSIKPQKSRNNKKSQKSRRKRRTKTR